MVHNLVSLFQKEQLQSKPSLPTQAENNRQKSTLLRHVQWSEHARWGRTWADAEVPPTLSLDKPALALTQQHNDYSDHMGVQSLTSLRSKPLSDTERRKHIIKYTPMSQEASSSCLTPVVFKLQSSELGGFPWTTANIHER